MKWNLDLARSDSAASLARAIREWIGDRGHPERYADVSNLDLVRDFVHTLDLLETVLGRFEIAAHLARLAMEQLEDPARVGSLGWDFWQIDVEEFFAANLLELCYQVSNAWERLEHFADTDRRLNILRRRHQKPSDTLLARHKATHFQPDEFERHRVADDYSVLRRPYRIREGRLEKELAKHTMPRVAALVKGAVSEALDYLGKFREATIG